MSYTVKEQNYITRAKTGEVANPYLGLTTKTVNLSGGSSNGIIVDNTPYLKLTSLTEQTVDSLITITKDFKAFNIYEGGIKLSDKYVTPTGLETRIAALVDSAPITLDTLNELAKALGNDPNFATTITNLIATKAPIDNPVFTGIPKVGTNVMYHAGNLNLPTVDFTARKILSSAIHTDLPLNIFTLENKAQQINAGGLLVSDNYTDSTKLPALGGWFKGNLNANNGSQVWDASNLNRIDTDFTAKTIRLSRYNSAVNGISFYSNAYNTWQLYMSPAGQVNSGVNGNITPPSGALVTSWGLRSLIENSDGYGWTWESMNNNATTPNIMAELSSATGNFKTTGSIITGNYINSNTFTGAGFTATGWGIDNAGNANLKSLTVRELTRFYELEINKIRATNGALAVTDAAVIDKVERNVYEGQYYTKITFKDINPFKVGDIIRCQQWTGSNIKGYKVSIGWGSFESGGSEQYILVYDDRFLIGDYTQIAIGDTIVRWNSTALDERKGLIYITSSDTGAPNMQVLYNEQVKVQLGNISGRAWKGNVLPDNKYGLWADGDVYINNGYFNGSVNSDTGTIGGWYINTNQLYSGTNGAGNTPMIRLSTANIGGGDIYYGSRILEGLSLTWHQSSNAGHIVFGQIAASGTTLRDNFKGLQMMSWDNQEYFCLSANAGLSGSKEVYNRIAGWGFDNWHLWNNNIELRSDGIIRHNADKWRFNNDGSGQLAGGNITWDTSGNARFAGNLNALSGTIGGFNIESNQLTSSTPICNFSINSNEGYLSIAGVLQYGAGSAKVGFNTTNNTSSVARFISGKDELQSSFTNAAAVYAEGIKILPDNYYRTAILTKGNIVSNHSCIGSGINHILLQGQAQTQLYLSFGTHFLINNDRNSGSVILPTLDIVTHTLGIIESTTIKDFCVRISICNKFSSYPFSLWSNDSFVMHGFKGEVISKQPFPTGAQADIDLYRVGNETWAQFVNWHA